MTPTDPVKPRQDIARVFDRAAPSYDRMGPRFFTHLGRRLVDVAQHKWRYR